MEEEKRSRRASRGRYDLSLHPEEKSMFRLAVILNYGSTFLFFLKKKKKTSKISLFFSSSLLYQHFRGDYQAYRDVGSSDDEIYDDEPKPKRKTEKKAVEGRGKKARTKECPGCGAALTLAMKQCSSCDYQFTSKSMLMSSTTAAEESQMIRERFPFEPERVSQIAI